MIAEACEGSRRSHRWAARVSASTISQLERHDLGQLARAEEIADLGMGEVDLSAIPPRRLAELSWPGRWMPRGR